MDSMVTGLDLPCRATPEFQNYSLFTRLFGFVFANPIARVVQCGRTLEHEYKILWYLSR